jgi:hypothetical protein
VRCERRDTTSVHSVGIPARSLNPGTAEEVAETALRGGGGRPAGTAAAKLVEDEHESLSLGANLVPEIPQDLGVLLDPQDEDAAHLLEVLYGGPRLLVLLAIQLELPLERLLLALEHPLLALEHPLVALEELPVLLPAQPKLLANALHELVASLEMTIDTREPLASGEHVLMIARRPDREGAQM